MCVVTLLVTARTSPRQATIMTDFLIVDRPSAYNAIIKRPTLNKLRAITSTQHLKLKFPIDNGVREIKEDQLVPQKCYITTLRAPNCWELVCKKHVYAVENKIFKANNELYEEQWYFKIRVNVS
jgi:hypothetical protein